ncbi:CAF17-like 4Fe-4S cluster assembly/insertion protein YgfZ [Aeoliella mucimassa]|uniref:Putative global regulator n=1 Tax=Aeoliella mucimassa TaxID=2527972 RepID=A0A518AV85_9BACT|nr:hypothetical protein [Aeoliella mucimassa]QDU58622.1 putative global regulator [Aeoliella mucimassa]
MSELRYFADWPASTLTIRGADRTRIVHNLCTADVNKLSPGNACEAFVTNVKGHVVAHCVVCCGDDVLSLVVLAADVAELAKHFGKYIISEDATVEVASEKPLLLTGSLEGCESADGFACTLTGADAWIVLAGNIERAEQLGYQAATVEQFDALRTAAGWPLAGVDFGESTLPQELNRNELAISFTKGCYLGQETIARLDALGHVNKQIAVVRASPGVELSVGTTLHRDDNLVGSVTTAALVGECWQSLAMIRRGSFAPGTQLDSEAGKVEVIAAVRPSKS